MKDHSLFEGYYTKEEVARFLGITARTLQNRVYRGLNHPPVIKGKLWRFPKDGFHRWLNAQMAKEIGEAS